MAVGGRLNGIRKDTHRPDFVHPEVWPGMSEPDQKADIKLWHVLRPKIQDAKRRRNRFHIPPQDVVN